MKTVAALMISAVAVNGFAPVPQRPVTDTHLLHMGLFDFLQPQKPKPKSEPGKMDAGVFGGKGKRITVREDEDNAMWIEEDKSGKRKSPWGK